MILASACLCGIHCRYDGNSCPNPKILELFNSGQLLPVCPEQLSGLHTPRVPVEILHCTGEDILKGKGKVTDKTNTVDSTKAFIEGAQKVLAIAKALNIQKAILKQYSPSCGFGKIYDGSFSGKTITGNGVTAALLFQNNIDILTEEDFIDS